VSATQLGMKTMGYTDSSRSDAVWRAGAADLPNWDEQSSGALRNAAGHCLDLLSLLINLPQNSTAP